MKYTQNVVVGNNFKMINSCPSIITQGNGRIHIGDNVTINSYKNTSWYCKTYLSCSGDGVIKIGNNVGMNGVMIHSKSSVTIGNYVHIGGGTQIYDTNFHSLDYLDRENPFLDCTKAVHAPVCVEDDVFIGTRVIIGKGITIGARSIIAAGSVVVKDIPADCIAGGNPCKVIKYLNNGNK